jgi:phosphoglycolate phosphatase
MRSMRRVRGPRRPIRGILFDKDGTIVDYWRTWVPINREVAIAVAGSDLELAARLLRAGGQDPDTDSVVPGSVLAAGSAEAIAGAFAEVLGRRAPRDLVSQVDRIFTEGGARHSVLIEGAREVLAELAARGFRLGLATNDTAGGLAASLGRHGLLEAFEFVAGCDSGHGAKPAPGMVLAFAAATGLDPSELAVVGDAAHDLEMAAAAGAGLKVGVLTGTSGRDDLAALADLILDSIADLPGHVVLGRVSDR